MEEMHDSMIDRETYSNNAKQPNEAVVPQHGRAFALLHNLIRDGSISRQALEEC